MPTQDIGLIAVLRERALGFKRPAERSALLHAGLNALQQLTDVQLLDALDPLVPLKAGRPVVREEGQLRPLALEAFGRRRCLPPTREP
jgi:hypothetical protein